MKKTIHLLLFLAILSTTAYSQDKDPQADYDWSKYDFTIHYTLKNGGGKKTFIENKRIFISNFQVTQVLVANGKATGISNLAKMTVGMTKIDMAKYQAVVDKLYNNAKERLVAEGYTIVSDEEVANSEFAKKEHNGKSIFCMYVKEPAYYKDGNGNQVVNICASNKFIVMNTNAITGTWPTRFGKAINANAVSIALTINPVSFDGSRGGGRKGPSISAFANMTIAPWCLASNDRGGYGVWGTPVDGKANWLGPNGMSETNNSVDVFGGVRGTYVLDVNEDIYLSEVEALGGGMVNGFLTSLFKELK